MSSNEAERPAQPAWRKTSFCVSGECVEIAQRGDLIILRDSTQPHSTMLHYDVGRWRDFVRNIKAGTFDDLGS